MGPGGTMPVPGISAVQTQETDESLTRRNETLMKLEKYTGKSVWRRVRASRGSGVVWRVSLWVGLVLRLVFVRFFRSCVCLVCVPAPRLPPVSLNR